jgi:hypothetical protein
MRMSPAATQDLNAAPLRPATNSAFVNSLALHGRIPEFGYSPPD